MITSLAAKMQYEAIKEAGTYGGGLADFIEENYPRFSVSNRTDTRATFRNGRITETPAEMSNEEKEEAWAEYQERNRPQMTDEERYRNEDLRLFSKSPSEIAEEEIQQKLFVREVQKVIKEADKNIPDSKIKAGFGSVKKWLVTISNRFGLDVEGYKHIVDAQNIRHIFNRHGEGNEQADNQIPVTDKDIANIPNIVNSPDYLVYGTKTDTGRDGIGYLKTIPDGTTYYVEEIRDKEKQLAAKTMYKIEGVSSDSLIQATVEPTSETTPSAVRLIDKLKKSTVVPAFTKNIASGITDVNNKLFSKAETVRGTYNPERRLIELFADQVLAEANIRNVPIEEVIQASDIVYENGGIRLKSQTEGGKSRVLADSSVNVEGEQLEQAMYRSKLDSLESFVNDVFNNTEDTSARYFSDVSQSGVNFDIPRDTVLHDKKHALTAVEWADVANNIDNIESATTSPKKRFDGQSVLLKIATPKGKYGVVFEHMKNGRNIITTAFKDTDTNIDTWIKNNSARAMQKASTTQKGLLSGRSMSDIISALENNVNNTLFQLPQGRKVYSVFDLKVGDYTSIGNVQEIDNENKTIKINDKIYSMLLLDTQIQNKGLSIIDKGNTQNNIDNASGENIKKASENRSEVDKQKLYNAEYNRKAKDYFGTTRNLNEAGYILTDGSLLDLSGKRQGASGGYRALDHLDVAEALENADMYDFINSGNIRYLPESDTIQIADIPTAAQYQTLSSIINKAGGEVTVQLISDAHNDSFSDYYREYEDLTLSKLKKDINAFYKGAGVQEITQYYQGKVAENVIDGHEVIDGFDENASNDAFVRTKEGRVEHGYITDELAKQIGSSKGGEIRLYNDLDKHIDKGRKKYILSQGYADLIDFVDDTISNWEKIYKGSDESFLITKSKNKDNIVAVKLERDGKYYKVSTALISRKDYLKNKKTLAERAQSNQLLTKSPGAISGTSDIHNIALKEGNVKYQNKPQPKGLYDAQKGVIKIFESADFSTLPHELAHYWLDNMWHYVRSGNASEKYRQRWNVIANWLNVKHEQAFLTRGQQEKFARGYEQYLLNGNLPTPIIKGAFDDYDRWLKRVYGDMNRLNVRHIDYKKASR